MNRWQELKKKINQIVRIDHDSDDYI
jgi:hypothetical protein